MEDFYSKEYNLNVNKELIKNNFIKEHMVFFEKFENDIKEMYTNSFKLKEKYSKDNKRQDNQNYDLDYDKIKNIDLSKKKDLLINELKDYIKRTGGKEEDIDEFETELREHLIWDDIANFFDNIQREFKEKIMIIPNTITDIYNQTIGPIVNFIKKLEHDDFFSKLFNDMFSKINEAFAKVKDFFKDIGEKIKKFFVDGWNIISEFFIMIYEKIKSFVEIIIMILNPNTYFTAIQDMVRLISIITSGVICFIIVIYVMKLFPIWTSSMTQQCTMVQTMLKLAQQNI